jgi:hypothetical protein
MLLRRKAQDNCAFEIRDPVTNTAPMMGRISRQTAGQATRAKPPIILPWTGGRRALARQEFAVIAVKWRSSAASPEATGAAWEAASPTTHAAASCEAAASRTPAAEARSAAGGVLVSHSTRPHVSKGFITPRPARYAAETVADAAPDIGPISGGDATPRRVCDIRPATGPQHLLSAATTKIDSAIIEQQDNPE